MGFPFCKKCGLRSVYDKRKDPFCHECWEENNRVDQPPSSNTGLVDLAVNFLIDNSSADRGDIGGASDFSGDGGGFSGGGASDSWSND